MENEVQIREVIDKVLSEEGLKNFIKIFEKEHNLFRGTHEKFAFPVEFEVPETIIRQIIVGGSLSDLDDVNVLSLKEGNILIYNPSTGKWKSVINGFEDNFDDSSLHWAWGTDNEAAGKTIVEANGVLTIAVTGSTVADWVAANNDPPKTIIGLSGNPCEVITKLNSFTINDDTGAGIYVSYNPTGTGAQGYMSITRYRNDSAVINGLAVRRGDTGILASNSITTLPIWLRMRISNVSYFGAKIIFSYSENGVDYADLYTQLPGVWATAAGNDTVVGLFVRNWGVDNAISAPFDFFKMKQVISPE